MFLRWRHRKLLDYIDAFASTKLVDMNGDWIEYQDLRRRGLFYFFTNAGFHKLISDLESSGYLMSYGFVDEHGISYMFYRLTDSGFVKRRQKK